MRSWRRGGCVLAMAVDALLPNLHRNGSLAEVTMPVATSRPRMSGEGGKMAIMNRRLTWLDWLPGRSAGQTFFS